jgi:hypothetical protein
MHGACRLQRAARARSAGVARAVAAGHEDADPAAAAAAFARDFAARYGGVRPRWAPAGWQEAARQAHAEFKFLFVYLHAASHQARPDLGQLPAASH